MFWHRIVQGLTAYAPWRSVGDRPSYAKEVEAVPIIRVTRKQIEEANQAREAALQKDDDFRLHEEQQQRLALEAA
jgi:hypothetical protein